MPKLYAAELVVSNDDAMFSMNGTVREMHLFKVGVKQCL